MYGDDTAAVSSGNIGNNVESEIWTEFTEEHTVAGVHNPDPYVNSHKIEAGTYVGDDTDNRNIALSSSIDIKYLIIFFDDPGAARTKSESMVGDTTKPETQAAFDANEIQSLGTGTFQLGDGVVNNSAFIYYFLAIGE